MHGPTNCAIRCVCVCVCGVCVCVCLCTKKSDCEVMYPAPKTHTHTNTHTHARTHTRTHTHTKYTHTHTHTHMCITQHWQLFYTFGVTVNNNGVGSLVWLTPHPGRYCAMPRDGKTYYCHGTHEVCLLYTSPSPRDYAASRMPSSA